ncbi:MAG: hypothetical protein HY236_13715 [Acidobacteria bacterium]|nr:hypothetical protein [Acidobacteriota bacterium]
MGILEGFLWGLVGGFFAELLGWFKLRQQIPSVPGFYWVITVLMIFAGGVMVVAYLRSNMPLNPLLSINVGAATPLIIASLVAQAPPIEPGRIN